MLGCGVDFTSFEHIGEWNRTSKRRNRQHSANENDPSYGMKGEALAGISALSHMEIFSKPQQCTASSGTAYLKYFHTDKISEVTIATNVQQQMQHPSHSTTVSVYDLFYNLPVRKRVMRGEAEVSSIRDFVQNMSILHHSISWTIRCGRLGGSSSSGVGGASSKPKTSVLLHLPSQASVAKRFIGFHGLQNMLNMQVINSSLFLSPTAVLIKISVRALCIFYVYCQHIS